MKLKGRQSRTGKRGLLASRDSYLTFATYVISIIIVFGVWQVAAQLYDSSILFPPPTAVGPTFGGLLQDGTILSASIWSVGRILAGFLCGSLIGAVLGLLIGTSATIRAALEPYVNFFRFIPVFAWFGPVILWFGSTEFSRVLLITYATLFVVAINTIAGVAEIAPNAVRMARSFGASGPQVFIRISVPGTMPYILTGLRLGLGNSFMTVVAAEFLQSDNGLGYLLSLYQTLFDMPAIFAIILCLGILGFAADRIYILVASAAGGRYLPTGRMQ